MQGDDSKLASVVSYAAFARWQREVLQLGPYKTQIEYWQNELKGIEPMLLPSDYPRPAKQASLFREHQCSFGCEAFLIWFLIPAEV